MNRNELRVGTRVIVSEGSARYEGTITAGCWGRNKLYVQYKSSDSPHDMSYLHVRNEVATNPDLTREVGPLRYMSKHQRYQASHGGSGGRYPHPVIVEQVIV